MRRWGWRRTAPYRKCAKIVGEVIGNYHPHGDALDLRHARPPGAGLQHALPPGRRPGQLRIDRRRSAGGVSLHRGAARGARRSDDGGSRQGDRRLRPQLRRDDRRADRPADAVPEPAGQRLDRHRRRHGDEHPAAQHARGDRRRHRASIEQRGAAARGRASRRVLAGGPGPDFPDRRLHRRPRTGIFQAYTTGRGVDHRARARRRSRRSKKGDKRLDRHHRDSVSGQQEAADREHRRAASARRRSRASPTCATSPTATACGSSSS